MILVQFEVLAAQEPLIHQEPPMNSEFLNEIPAPSQYPSVVLSESVVWKQRWVLIDWLVDGWIDWFKLLGDKRNK